MSLTPPKTSAELLVSFPAPHVILLTMNRPEQLNAMTPQLEEDMRVTLNWFEHEPELWVAIVTGRGRLFCAGADLKAWNQAQANGEANEAEGAASGIHGFGSLSGRRSIKPIIAAVAGGAYGGGTEMILNCDYVVASEDGKFALPEVKRGVVAGRGGIPRLSQIAGHHLAADMLLLGRIVPAQEAYNRFGFVNKLVPRAQGSTLEQHHAKVVEAALETAREITANSPDSVQSTKLGLLLAQDHGHLNSLMSQIWSPENRRVFQGDNIKEGLKAFSEKRKPNWSNPSKL